MPHNAGRRTTEEAMKQQFRWHYATPLLGSGWKGKGGRDYRPGTLACDTLLSLPHEGSALHNWLPTDPGLTQAAQSSRTVCGHK